MTQSGVLLSRARLEIAVFPRAVIPAFALLSGENEVLQKCAGIAPCIENFPWKFSAISSSFQRKLESSAFADFQVAGFQLSLE
ncbi:hypothetical protein [Dyella sp.]|uniref:hypothetical protein n=1 Tax=Dyella sp. TaxID=1869338 RepID=UPI002FD9DE88